MSRKEEKPRVDVYTRITDRIVADLEKDLDAVAEILGRDFADRFRDKKLNGSDHRLILSSDRSMGSVIKLLTPSDVDFTDEYNAWLRAIPQHIKELVFVVKRFYRPEWGDDWPAHFSVGRINGRAGHALRLDGDKITVNMLRVGFAVDGSWRLFGLRHDFHPATKVQTEDDITASIVVPGAVAGRTDGLSRKYVTNCEQLLFQLPTTRSTAATTSRPRRTSRRAPSSATSSR